MSESHYQILQISFQSSAKQIKAAFKRQIRKHHPDKNITTEGPSKDSYNTLGLNLEKKQISMRVIEAYQCLTDPDKRKVYDQQLRIQTLKYQLKQARHKDTVSLSAYKQAKTYFGQSPEQKNNQTSEQTKKALSQENTSQQQEDVTILVCQQCFGQNQVEEVQLKQLHKVQLSINCRHCGLYIAILE